jgi:hypothetical protein
MQVITVIGHIVDDNISNIMELFMHYFIFNFNRKKLN